MRALTLTMLVFLACYLDGSMALNCYHCTAMENPEETAGWAATTDDGTFTEEAYGQTVTISQNCYDGAFKAEGILSTTCNTTIYGENAFCYSMVTDKDAHETGATLTWRGCADLNTCSAMENEEVRAQEGAITFKCCSTDNCVPEEDDDDHTDDHDDDDDDSTNGSDVIMASLAFTMFAAAASAIFGL